MNFNHLAPATVSLLISVIALTGCAEERMKSTTSTSSSVTTTTVTTTGTGAEANAASGSAPQNTLASNGASSTSGPAAGAGKADDPNNVSNLKPYTPPKMAPGFPGKGDPKNWTRATKFYNQGIDASGSRKWAEAIKFYNLAIAEYPYDANFYANLGFALERSGNPAGGAEACKKGLQLEKGFGGAWENLGNCQYDLGKYEDSRESFNQAVKCELTVAKREELMQVIQKLTKIINESKH